MYQKHKSSLKYDIKCCESELNCLTDLKLYLFLLFVLTLCNCEAVSKGKSELNHYDKLVLKCFRSSNKQ